jgi:hypothetical protein
MNSVPNKKNDLSLEILSSVIDYIIFGLNMCLHYSTSLTYRNESCFWLRLLELLLKGIAATILSIGREKIHFSLLGSRVSKFKRNKTKDPRFQSISNYVTVIFSTDIALFLLETHDLLWLDDSFDLSLTFWKKTFLPFYGLLILRDLCSLAPIHNLMHSNPIMYKLLHKKHHEITKNAESLHAYHINFLDLMVENTTAPLLLFFFQHQLGMKPGVSYTTITLFFRHDFALHSVNPYSVMYFNPILDFWFKPNIFHQLHHALNKDYILFVPYCHILPWERRKDERKYNEIFKTTFSFSSLRFNLLTQFGRNKNMGFDSS